jgi:hypothetical protein
LIDDRLDPLACAAELAETGFFVFAVGADELRAERSDERFEVLAGEAFVAEDRVPVKLDTAPTRCPASSPASPNASSRSPQQSGSTGKPANQAEASSPTTTNPTKTESVI